jgi:hypothetical protein
MESAQMVSLKLPVTPEAPPLRLPSADLLLGAVLLGAVVPATLVAFVTGRNSRAPRR